MTPFVGRDAEARELADFLGEVGDDSAALIVEGEPGIGKTTLWQNALRRAVSNGVLVLTARPAAADSVLAYAGLTDLLADVDSDVWADLPEPQRHGLAVAMLRESPSDVVVDQRAVGAALLTVLNRLAIASPVVIAIDDLQWLDDSSAAVVAFAARRLRGRVMLLCTARSGGIDPTATEWLQLAHPDSVRRIRLMPLAIGELQDVLVAKLGSPIPRPRLLRVHQMSGGNPFYAIELARELRWRGDDGELSLPDSLTELTQFRISRLDDGAHDALLAIASLADPTLRAVAKAVDATPQHLIEMLREAETQRIVTVGDTRVRFTHPLLAHAVRLGVTPPRHRAMHRRLAEVVDEPELRARHLALGDPLGEADTLEALDIAADSARARGAPAAAVELLGQAIALGGATESRRTLLAQCLFDSGDPRRARDVLESVIAELSPGPRRALALKQLAMVRVYGDSFSEAAYLLESALADCGDEPALRADVMTTLAFAQLNTGRPAEARETAERAADIAASQNPSEVLGRALGMRAMMRFMAGEGVTVSDLRRAAAMTHREDAMPVALRPSVQEALLSGYTGELATAHAALAQVWQHCVAVGEEGEAMLIAFNLVLFDIWRGDITQAAERADDADRRAQELGGDAARFVASSVQGAVAAYQGRVEDARRHLETALTAGRGSGYVQMMALATSILVFLELSVGDSAAALACSEPLLPLLHQVPKYTEIIGAGFVPDAAEALINLGRLDEAEPLVQALEANGTRLDRAWMLAVGWRCRALLCASRGDVATAVTHANAALAQIDRIQMPFERARTLLVLGRLERRQRHRRPGTALMNEALSVFDELGNPLWAAQVRAELDRGTPGRTRSSGLTPSEQRVAELAVAGMSNHDIAATLFIAQKTVEVNLSRIYQKLGIHSRTELFRVFADTESPNELGPDRLARPATP